MKLLQYEEEDFLNELSWAIEKEYNLPVKRIDAVDSENFTAFTRKEKIHIETAESMEPHLIFISGIYDYIREKGFKKVVKIYRAKNGKRYVSIKNKFYVVSDHIDEGRQSFSLQGNEFKVVKAMADFHKCALGYSPPAGGKSKCDWGKWIEKFRKQYRCLKRYREELICKTDRTPFQESYVKYSETFLDRMDRSIKILKNSGYIDAVEESMKSRQICIGSFKHSNFYIKDSEVYLRTLNKCRYDILEKDIADFLQKVAEYNFEKGTKICPGLIKEYKMRNNLSPNSVEIIKGLLLFPEEIEKVCSRYYRGKDKWTEDLYIMKLKSAIELEEKKAMLVNTLEGLSFN